MNQGPPRWIGPALIGAGVVLGIGLGNREAAMVAALVAVAVVALFGALGAFAAVVAAGKADRAAGWTEEEIRRRADDLADTLRDKMTTDHAEVAAAAVIQDEPISTSGRSHNLNRGGHQGSQPTSSPAGGYNH